MAFAVPIAKAHTNVGRRQLLAISYARPRRSSRSPWTLHKTIPLRMRNERAQLCDCSVVSFEPRVMSDPPSVRRALHARTGRRVMSTAERARFYAHACGRFHGLSTGP